ncbi:hypothetical protein [Roseospirillum parvum]|uniref:Uncharacterized protein n=1 Tax=Roseospirillum parvum TaxID=83401 RepID=A0A1G7WE66_9PROT|nr:hypothetical protein [Roseospirillum parvum]SDG70271.1 hypothetical protein SAMN05421742_102166 [Roseospirillum parvum]
MSTGIADWTGLAPGQALYPFAGDIEPLLVLLLAAVWVFASRALAAAARGQEPPAE